MYSMSPVSPCNDLCVVDPVVTLLPTFDEEFRQAKDNQRPFILLF